MNPDTPGGWLTPVTDTDDDASGPARQWSIRVREKRTSAMMFGKVFATPRQLSGLIASWFEGCPAHIPGAYPGHGGFIMGTDIATVEYEPSESTR